MTDHTKGLVGRFKSWENSKTHSWTMEKAQDAYHKRIYKWVCKRCHMVFINGTGVSPVTAAQYSCDEWILKRVYDD